MERYKVIITPRSFTGAGQGAVELLESNNCDVVRIAVNEEGGWQRLCEEIKDADAVIAGLELYDEELILRGSKLKVISRYGVGYDQVDVKAAAAANIAVTITPGANGDSVADFAVALMLDAARNVTIMDTAMKKRCMARPQGAEMWNKTVGIIGTGRIGRGVARRCLGFQMRILGYDLFENDDFKMECGGTYVSFTELLRESDFITIHLPLTRKTERLIGMKELEMMKRTAILVNTARGGIIDEQALYQALDGGMIRAAALDATENEPAYYSPLINLSNCILTPHAGAATDEAGVRMSIMAAQNVVDVLRFGSCEYTVQ